jgi:hypothetical protein
MESPMINTFGNGRGASNAAPRETTIEPKQRAVLTKDLLEWAEFME